MADPRVKQLAFDALALSLTGPIELLGSNQPRRPLLGEDAVTRNLRSPILDNFQEASMTAYEPTTRERLAAGTQTGLEFLGMRRPQARSVSQGIFGGPSSPILANLGIADVVPFVGTALQTEEAVDALGRAGQLAGQGQYGQAAVETGMGILGLVPGAQATNRAAGVIGDRAVQAITGNPQATAMGALEAAGQMAPLARIFKPEQVKAVLPDTKAVGANDEPLVLYSGSQNEIKQFDDRSGIAFPAWFTDRPDVASAYALDPTRASRGERAPTVYPSYLDLRNPLVVDAKGAKWNNIKVRDKNVAEQLEIDAPVSTTFLAYAARQKGYDGVIIKNVKDNPNSEVSGISNVYVPFSPDQIKSATNDPAFMGLLEPEDAQTSL